MSGWIKLHRELVKWEWYTDTNTCHLFIHLLLSANHQTTKWRGHTIEAGQLLTGRIKLAQETGLSERNVRTALEKLKSTKEVTSRNYNKYSIITITNWKVYQQIDQQPTSETSDNRPATDQQPTTSNNVNKGKNEKEIKNNIDFENFWNLYGYKTGRAKCEVVYGKIIKSGVSPEAILQGVKNYKLDCQRKGVTEMKFIKQPLTWLNGKHWQDEYPDSVVLSDEDEIERIKNAIHGGDNGRLRIN